MMNPWDPVKRTTTTSTSEAACIISRQRLQNYLLPINCYGSTSFVKYMTIGSFDPAIQVAQVALTLPQPCLFEQGEVKASCPSLT